MRVPNEYYDIFFVIHTGPQVIELWTDPEGAVAALEKMVMSGMLVELSYGLQAFSQLCFTRGRGNKVALTMVEVKRQLQLDKERLEAWRHGRK